LGDDSEDDEDNDYDELSASDIIKYLEEKL
jgi:hypothetical protein